MRMIGIKINLNFNRDKEFHNIEFYNWDQVKYLIYVYDIIFSSFF